MAKIVQIAQEIGVSAATVSRALSRPEMVARVTRERVLKKARELGLEIPGSAAAFYQDPQQPPHKVIGVVIADLTNDFSAGILKAITNLAEQDGIQVMLGVTNESVSTERKIFAEFNQYNLMGVIAMPVGSSAVPLIECRNIVAVDRLFIGRETKSVLLNNAKAVQLAYEHLKSKNHKHIAYISGRSSLYTFRERLQTARSFADMECIELDALEYNDLYTRAFELTNILLSRPESQRPTAILTSNNAITSGVAYSLTLRNVPMPEKMAFVSIGDPEWCRFFPTPITTVKIPEDELGIAAYEMIKHPEQPVKQRIIEPMLLVRSSS